jgi:hypothetical protein
MWGSFLSMITDLFKDKATSSAGSGLGSAVGETIGGLVGGQGGNLLGSLIGANADKGAGILGNAKGNVVTNVLNSVAPEIKAMPVSIPATSTPASVAPTTPTLASSFGGLTDRITRPFTGLMQEGKDLIATYRDPKAKFMDKVGGTIGLALDTSAVGQTPFGTHESDHPEFPVMGEGDTYKDANGNIAYTPAGLNKLKQLNK